MWAGHPKVSLRVFLHGDVAASNVAPSYMRRVMILSEVGIFFSEVGI